MGVRGLKTFVDKHDGLFNKDHRLHDTHIVIDASNLVCVLYKDSQKQERRDLFGGDMVQFGRYVMSFFATLERCRIVPVLVFDGAQTYDQSKSKTTEKHRRALDRFQAVMSINKLGFGDFILPATATNVFRSVAVDLKIKIIQCMYEADLEVARMAHELKCPVISNDSDFFLMNLPHGLIPIDYLFWEQSVLPVSTYITEVSSHIESWLFKQENFLRYIPGLDPKSLPLLGVLVGNDFIAGGVFDKACSRISAYHDPRESSRNFKNVTGNRQHQKIIKILHFLCNKTPNEIINLVCAQMPRERRPKIKEMIISNLTVYDIPKEDDFEVELRNLYWRGFQETYGMDYDQDELLFKFDRTMDQLTSWLRNAMEQSVLSYRCLELANRNIIFIINHMDDPQLPSAHECQIPSMRVMLALLKSSHKDRISCLVYDRVGNTYAKKVLKPFGSLDNYGQLNFTFYDLPRLPASIRQRILLATFHSSHMVFEANLVDFLGWFAPEHAEEYLILKLLMEYVDIESHTAKLWRHFKQATLLCFMHYLWKYNKEQQQRLQEIGGQDEEFMEDFAALVKHRKLDRMPALNKKRKYNCRLMHQITQLQCSIISFNGLNAFLGDVMTRLRTEYWLNSCLIYNLSEHLHNRTIKLPTMPDIIHLRPH